MYLKCQIEYLIGSVKENKANYQDINLNMTALITLVWSGSILFFHSPVFARTKIKIKIKIN